MFLHHCLENSSLIDEFYLLCSHLTIVYEFPTAALQNVFTVYFVGYFIFIALLQHVGLLFPYFIASYFMLFFQSKISKIRQVSLPQLEGIRKSDCCKSFIILYLLWCMTMQWNLLLLFKSERIM